jgi:hypothetical protein
MAHFAELNNSNEVLRVIVISNDDVEANGGELSSEAETFVASIVPHSEDGTAWKQTSYNSNFRKQYAGIGHTYDASKNKFISPQPYPSWSLDSNDDWEAPVTYPTITEIDSEPVIIYWDEDNQKWLGATHIGDPIVGDPIVTTNYEWDATNLQWNEV